MHRRWARARLGGLLLLSALTALTAPRAALAADDDKAPVQEGVRIDQLQPASPESPFLRVEGPHVPQLDRVEFAFGLTLDYGLRPVRAAIQRDDTGDEELGIPVRHALLAHIGGSLTPIHWLSFDFAIPFGLAVSGDTIEGQNTREAQSPRVGDPREGVHVRVVDELALGVFLGGRFWAPIGAEEAYLGDKELRAEIEGGVAGDLPTLLYGCMLGLGPGFFAQRNGDRVAASCALHAKVGGVASIGFEPTFALFADEGNTETTYRPQFEPMGAGRLKVGDFRIGLAAGPGFGTAPGMPAFRTVLQFAYVGGGEPEKPPPPPPPDSDLDKILDKDDACPREAGPASSDATKNGCPSQDRDADGIRDDEDWCPDRAGISHANPNANGCPDTDNDQLPDPIDACRNEPGPAPQGCPKFARLQKDTFRVDPPIEFEGRSPNLSADAKTALEEIAATMRANPKIEQVSVSLGTKGARADLSDKRAQQIFLVFRLSNLDSNRYEVVLRDDLKAGTVQIKLVR